VTRVVRIFEVMSPEELRAAGVSVPAGPAAPATVAPVSTVPAAATAPAPAGGEMPSASGGAVATPVR